MALHRKHGTALLVTALLLGGGSGAAVTTAVTGPAHASSTPPGAAVGLPPSVIDLPAVDTVAPADAVVNVRTEFGARGDGVTDDTAAIQRAISAGLGIGNTDKVLYFPAGTYLVSKPLEWRAANGSWSTALTLLGQNRDRTVIQLSDGAAGFGDPAQPRAVIVTGSQNPTAADGSGNQAFNNFIFDLTVDVGAANPGANGIDFLAHNRGAIRNVVVRASAGSGNTGIAMTRRWPGPCLLQDVRVDGFARGVHLSRWEYGATMENLRLSGQRVAGIENGPNLVSIRGLLSRNTVPAVRNGVASSRDSSVTLLDSRLLGGAPDAAAVVNEGSALLRGVSTSGYGTPVRNRGVDRSLSSSGEWSSSAPVTRHGSTGAGLRLPVAEAPGLPAVGTGEWASAAAYGARAGDGVDDTVGLQAALDSGKPVVYLRPGWYGITRTLRVPPTVKAIVGFEAAVDATRGDFAGTSTGAVFSVTGVSTVPVLFDQLVFKASPAVVNVERVGDRPVALRHVHMSGRPFRGTPGPLYLTDVDGGRGWHFTPGQQVWARQFNAEQVGTKVISEGADLWVLGVKTESAGTVIASRRGARTEVLGGLLYATAASPTPVPAFSAVDSAQSLSFTVGVSDPSRRFLPLVTSTRGGVTTTVTHEQVPRSGLYGSAVALYTDVDPASPSPPAGATPAPSPSPGPSPSPSLGPVAPTVTPLRVNAGGGPVAGWTGDTAGSPSAYGNAAAALSRATSTSLTVARHPSVPAHVPAAVFATERWDQRSGVPMRWAFPVTPGEYDVRLYFADTYSGTQRAGARTFDVSVEGRLVLDDYDVVRDVGGSTGVMKSFRVTGDSVIDVEFAHVVENPTLRGIEVLPVGAA